ncbi:MAG: histidine--tRNA ligase [Armatimonadetes bacterium]|nr:histidine--tRNA ligase [Armatimonadota bacterium]
MKYRRPKGTFDILPDDAPRWRAVESAFRDICARYGYGEIRTPIFEDTDLFIRSVGEETDIVSKEMYTFEDKGGRSQTLRAEGTAPTVRAFIEENLQGQDPERLVRLYYLAPIFRYDRPQAGRYRQHHQAGIEALGSMNPAVDAEIIDLALVFYRALGIEGTRLLINSVGCPRCAPAYVETLKAALSQHADELCGDCRRRLETNPLRVLDCKKETCREITAAAPTMLDALCDECAEHFAGFRRSLDTLGIAYEIDPRIVRGLDYYTKTAFELRHDALGAQDSIGGGGRYDGLVEQCGGKPTPGVGMGMGIERILLVREALGVTDTAPEREGVFVVTLGDEAWEPGYRLVHDLRAAGLHADIDYRRRSMRAQLRHADKEGFARAIIIGEDELAKGVATVRDMQSSEQTEVAMDQLAEHLGVT